MSTALYGIFGKLIRKASAHRMMTAGAVLAVLFAGSAVFCASCIDELDYSVLEKRSRVLYASDGSVIGYSLSEDTDSYRFYTTADEVSPLYLKMLIANEDRNFYGHHGVDFPALLRALKGNLSNGRVTSGGSTLAMQVVKRLAGHEEKRTYLNKLREIVQAVYITGKFGREKVLEWYLTLAPYGGNTEGVKAASLRWFGHLPNRMTPSEAALLTALPRAPEHIRPDRHPQAAAYYINEVLRSSREKGVFGDDVWKSSAADELPKELRGIGQSARTLAVRLFSTTGLREIYTHIDPKIQQVLHDEAAGFHEKHNDGAVLSVVVLDASTHEITGILGSSDLSVSEVCLPYSPRSPGSALKPFAYGLAFEEGKLHPQTVLHDKSKLFGSWRPENFDRRFNGRVTASRALASSLNLPAIEVLGLIGPGYFVNSLNRFGNILHVGSKVPDYSVILGSADITLVNLAKLYAMLNEDGMLNDYSLYIGEKLHEPARFMSADSARAVFDILKSTGRPATAPNAADVSYKTGTSSRFTDALSVGSLENHTVAVAIRFPDNVTGLYQYSGFRDAAPVLFSILGKLPSRPMNRPDIDSALLSGTSPDALTEIADDSRITDRNGLHIDFPQNGDTVLPDAFGRIFINHSGGEGRILLSHDGVQTEEMFFTPEAEGFYTVSIMDESGHSDSVTFRVVLDN
ncbi:transglycosylase domain-containing protein [uncultured Ruminobacter sp.]|uniref:transglycosylase domain-containing protein n=1 Tax=uncultured Ruminobacter sp. TaxID=538947 RepID=UPI0025FA922F|nr:transglycosylase domain-containing protein [uncultured Ruminobacter sp.]